VWEVEHRACQLSRPRRVEYDIERLRSFRECESVFLQRMWISLGWRQTRQDVVEVIVGMWSCSQQMSIGPWVVASVATCRLAVSCSRARLAGGGCPSGRCVAAARREPQRPLAGPSWHAVLVRSSAGHSREIFATCRASAVEMMPRGREERHVAGLIVSGRDLGAARPG